jgi:hypothetical protein
VKFRLSPEDVQFADRDFREHRQRIEAALDCDGLLCQAPGAPHDPLTPHFHLVMTAPDLKRERRVYVNPAAGWLAGRCIDETYR